MDRLMHTEILAQVAEDSTAPQEMREAAQTEYDRIVRDWEAELNAADGNQTS